MASYDSIVVGEDWISEYYFTTDSPRESFQGKVIELRKQWDAEVKEGRDTVRQQLLANTRELHTALSTLAENPGGAADAHAMVRRTFGYSETLSDFTGERAGTELRLPHAHLPGVTSALLRVSSGFWRVAALFCGAVPIVFDPCNDPRLMRGSGC